MTAAPFLPDVRSLRALRKAAAACRGCPLHRNATQTVFGAGPADARVMFVGEQPGNDEDLAGAPFVGPAGRELDRGLARAGIDRAVLGFDNGFPGGFAQRMLLSERLVLRVPDALSSDAAALTEPVSVGFLYARIANPAPGDVPLVVGCGMIGLTIVAALRHAGVAPIVASEFSAQRRTLAVGAGADEVVDPAHESPFDVWKRAARRVKRPRALIFECVGVPGVLGPILEQAPWLARVVVAGACLEPDTLFTAAAHTKGINVQFGGLPIAEDFSGALRAIGEGTVDVGPWLTGRAGLGDAVAAFERAKDANAHARMIIRPND